MLMVAHDCRNGNASAGYRLDKVGNHFFEFFGTFLANAAVAVVAEQNAQIRLEFIKSGVHHLVHIRKFGIALVVFAFVNVSEKKNFEFSVFIEFEIHFSFLFMNN